MLIVAGLSLRNMRPRVWDPKDPHYIPELGAVMVTYADVHAMPTRRKQAMEEGLHASLGIPKKVKVYLDNGSFFFKKRQEDMPLKDYTQFVEKARPDWFPVPQDFIPLPKMDLEQQQECLTKTMRMNKRYSQGYVPVVHVSRVLGDYIAALMKLPNVDAQPSLALGGIVPNLLRTPNAISHKDILGALRQIKAAFPSKEIHVFGMGGTATMHMAALLKFDSVDSTGWRNRAARGLIQLPGLGDREVVKMGSWEGRPLSEPELEVLAKCRCPACKNEGIKGLKAEGIEGFSNRATHNLWVLLKEGAWLNQAMEKGTYLSKFKTRLQNSTYRRIIEQIVAEREGQESPGPQQQRLPGM